MKVVHIESGLGNQMLSYSEYLVLKKLHPEENIYIETLVFDIPECNDVICQWNGYELKSIFGIDAPNVREHLAEGQWDIVEDYVRKSKFWEDNWDYPHVYVEAFEKAGISLKNQRGSTHWISQKSLKAIITNNRLGYDVKRWLRPFYAKRYIEKLSTRDKIFDGSSDDTFTGQFLGLMHKNSGIEFVEDEIRAAFAFPEFTDKRNLEMKKNLENSNSVAIHARRGDMLHSNGYCYKYGYFKRATSFIKKNVENPLFIFFCDPGSVEWCKENLKIFGLDLEKDRIQFVDWNKGKDSYKDMQLMGCCKHNIITFSSFGWWGTFFNQNPNKITCSPNVYINTTHTF